MRSWAWAAACGLAAAAGASPAFAGDEEMKKELEETRAQVRRLTQRVEELEGRGAGGDLGKAVEKYLQEHPPAACGVTTPFSKSIRISGHVLFWWERLDGVYRTGDPAGEDVNEVGWLRVSLQADADIAKDLRARVEIRDARASGQEPATNGQLQTATGGTDLKQGWFEADDLFGCGTRTRVGRQVLSYGDQRLLGELDWHTYGRSFDAALFSHLFEGPGTKVDLFAARVVERNFALAAPPPDNDDRTLLGLYTVTPKALHHSDLDAYLLLVKDNLETAGEAGGMGNTTIWTGGTRIVGARNALDWGTEWAIQRGELSGDRLSAWAGHARAGYTMADTGWTPRLGVEWDMATGDDDPADGDRESFQTLFPTNHDKYGILDVAAWQNLQAWRASVGLHPAKNWSIDADWWRLYVEDGDDAWYGANGVPIRGGAPGASKYLGSEADLVLSWRPNERMKVAVGGAQFFDGGFVRDTGGGNDSFWFYIRVQVWF